MSAHDTALAGLSSEVPAERLEAARYLQFWAVPGDIPALRTAIQRESVAWVRRALEAGLSRLGDVSTTRVDLNRLVQDEAAQSADAEALGRARIARSVVHEVEPIVGLIELYARMEIEDYSASRTRLQVERLSRILSALETLAKVTAAPRVDRIDVARLLRRVVDAERLVFSEPISLEGKQPLVVISDAGLLELILRNALKNACEAASEVAELPNVVAVFYGTNDRDLWISVHDNGLGLPLGSTEQLFEMGTSTKEDHLGFGLTLASQAAKVLGGDIRLSSDSSGTRFELTIPLQRGIE